MKDTLRTSPNRLRFLTLRLQTLGRVPGFRGGAAAQAQLASLWTRAESLGLVHYHHADAQLMAFRDPEVWFGGPATLAFVDRDPRSVLGLRAIVAAVRAAREVLDETTWMEVDAMDLPLVEALLGEGFDIESVQQLGSPRACLERLIARYDPPIDPRIELARADDVDAIVALHRDAFTKQPEHCFFGAYPEHLLRLREDIAQAVRKRSNGHWVVRDGGVRGHIEADVNRDHPLWGDYAGMAMVFDERLRGQGLVKSAYRVALSGAIANGATLLKGGTSQPAVLGLGQVMQRPWYAFGMRRQRTFPPDHFLRFHPHWQVAK